MRSDALRPGIVRLVAGREIRTRLASKSFRIATGILLLLAIAAPVGAALFDSPSGDELEEFDIALIGPVADDADVFTGVAAGAATLRITADDRSADVLIDDAELSLDGVFDGTTLSTSGTPDPLLVGVLDRGAQVIRLVDVAEATGVDPDSVLAAATGSIEVDDVDADESDADSVRLAVGFIATLALFLLVQVFGSQTASSVVEEKGTRVIEVLLAHVRPRELLAGKVIGVAVLAAVEMGIVAAGLSGALAFTSSVSVPTEVWGSVGVLLVVFVVGFLFYAVLFAAAGSLVSRQEDVQQVLLPLITPLMLGYFVGLTPGLASGPVGVAMAYIPFTSPAVLPSRYAAGDLVLWQVALAVVILVVATAFALRIAAKVYEASILRVGTRVRVRDALRTER